MLSAGGRDFDAIAKVARGVITMTLSILSRYMHLHHMIMYRDDYDATVRLVTAFVQKSD